MLGKTFKFFAGSSNLPLAQKVALGLGIKLAKSEIHKFSNNETRVRIDENVNGKTCFLLQSISTPTDENWVQTLFFIDAFKRSGAKKIVGILPWIGYQKQDKAFRKGEAISAAVVVKTLEAMGMEKVITFDFHSPLIKTYFQNPPVVLSAFPLFLGEIKKIINNDKNRHPEFISGSTSSNSSEEMLKQVQHDVDYVMVAPDKGAYWASDFAKKLGIGLVQINKTRDKKTARVTIAGCHPVSGCIDGKTCIIIDDNIYTGSTLILNARLLKQNGAKAVLCFVTHPVLSGDAPSLLQNSEIDSLTVTDTIYVSKEKMFPKLKIISVAQQIIDTLLSS